MGRPATKPTKLKDGFYLEIRNKGAKSESKLEEIQKKQCYLQSKNTRELKM